MAAEPFIPPSPPRIRSGNILPEKVRDIEVADLPTVKHQPFKRLKMRHRRVIVLHLQGVANTDIAVALGCSAGYVSQVLRNPTVIPILQRCYEDYEAEFQSLTPLCIKALRRNIECGEGAIELKAVDIAFRRQGVYEKKVDTSATAEDVIERILKITGRDGSRLEFSERRFLKAGEQPTTDDHASKDESQIIDV